MTKERKKVIDVDFTLNENDDFDDILCDFIEVYENSPVGFDIDQLDGSFEESEWADQEGELEASPTNFIVKIDSDSIPAEGSCSIYFTAWQEAYADVGEKMHGLAYHGSAHVSVSLKKAWRDDKNNLYAEYEISDLEEG
jgi:hypothetical protein